MSEPVLKPSSESVEHFLEKIPHPKKQEEAKQLIVLYQQVTSFEPIIWGGGIIGFGEYQYRYNSGRKGIAPLTAFAPRKARHSIYLEPKFSSKKELLTQLGKHKEALGCIYVNKLADIDLTILQRIISDSMQVTLNKSHADKL